MYTPFFPIIAPSIGTFIGLWLDVLLSLTLIYTFFAMFLIIAMSIMSSLKFRRCVASIGDSIYTSLFSTYFFITFPFWFVISQFHYVFFVLKSRAVITLFLLFMISSHSSVLIFCFGRLYNEFICIFLLFYLISLMTIVSVFEFSSIGGNGWCTISCLRLLLPLFFSSLRYVVYFLILKSWFFFQECLV